MFKCGSSFFLPPTCEWFYNHYQSLPCALCSLLFISESCCDSVWSNTRLRGLPQHCVLSAPAGGIRAGHFQQLGLYLLGIVGEAFNEGLDEPFSAAFILNQLHSVIYNTNSSTLFHLCICVSVFLSLIMQ